MTESSFRGENDLTAGATAESQGDVPDSATADRAAAFDDPTSTASGNATEDDAVIASPPGDSDIVDNITPADRDSSIEADVDAGYDDETQGGTGAR